VAPGDDFGQEDKKRKEGHFEMKVAGNTNKLFTRLLKYVKATHDFSIHLLKYVNQNVELRND